MKQYKHLDKNRYIVKINLDNNYAVDKIYLDSYTRFEC
jgi:hypothetical protein